MSALRRQGDVHQSLGGVEAGEDGDQVGRVVVPPEGEELGARVRRHRRRELLATPPSPALARHGPRSQLLK